MLYCNRLVFYFHYFGTSRRVIRCINAEFITISVFTEKHLSTLEIRFTSTHQHCMHHCMALIYKTLNSITSVMATAAS